MMNRNQGQQRSQWRKWRNFFAGRRHRRQLPNPFVEDSAVKALPASLARSLAIFQLGESGGGTIVQQVRQSGIGAVDNDYAAAMQMFVEEEHHHAELLACAVRMLGGELIRRNWTAKLFVFARRLLGLRLKVTVLLVAEVVGICYYHLLASNMPASRLRNLLRYLVEDELSHLDFHCSFLRTQTRGPLRVLLFRILWRALSVASSLVVLIDHRACLRDMGVPYGTAWKQWMKVSRHAENLATCHSPAVATASWPTPG